MAAYLIKQIPQLFFIVLFLSSCNDVQVNETIYNETYSIGKITDINDFETLNEFDKKLAKHANSVVGKGGYRNNRSRIFMKLSTNGKKARLDPEFYTGVSTPCYSSLDKETLNLRVGVGFFGGFGFNIKIFKDKFLSSYFSYTDDVKPYKTNLSGEFTDNFELRSKFQSLILNEQPTFKPGQQLTGYLTFTSPNWYENTPGNQLDTNYVKGRIYFTCLTN